MLLASWCYLCLVFAPTFCLAAQFSCSAVSDVDACLPTWFVSLFILSSTFVDQRLLLDKAFSAFACHTRRHPMLKHLQVPMRKSNHNSSPAPHRESEPCRGGNNSAHNRRFLLDLRIFSGLRWILQFRYNPKSANLRRQQDPRAHLPDSG